MSSSSSSLTEINQATPGVHLQNLVICTNMSIQEKIDCFKVLKVVVKNLADPVKANDTTMKYRQLRLSNPKIHQTVGRHGEAMAYLQAIGFVITQDETTTKEKESLLKLKDSIVNVALFQTSLQEVTTALEMVDSSSSNNTTTNTNKRSLSRCSSSNSSTYSSSSNNEEKKSSYEPRITEKQKARLLLEQKEKEEKQKAKQLRKQTSAQIKMDKHVRLNDPNWKPSVAAAAAKAGDSMSTFRDKYGE
mmetsp:Transcript_29363/g.41085  ORF Transcript_29363/g.41085 Transcript_29363/m.41085 type:complete len:247 (-) Transcript_29363:54-794(-)